MDNRFTLKDFIFVVLFVGVIGAVAWVGYQFNYQEGRLNDVKGELSRLSDQQKQQLGVSMEIRNALRGGVRVATGNGDEGSSTQGASAQEASENVRRKNPDGSLFVYYPNAPRPPRHQSSKPDYATGDWLVLNFGSEPKVLTPFIEKDFYGQLAQAPVMENLLTMNPETLQYEPLLAESYEISADGLMYRFRLRKGLVCSDGVPFTADDVIFSFKTVMNPDVDDAPLRGYFSAVKSIEKEDDRTVVVRMTEPYFGALNTLGASPMLPEHVYKFEKGEDYNKRGDLLVGTGPYKLQTWDRGQRLVMVRNDRYWGERPTFDKIIFTFITNQQAAVQALQGGELDSYASNWNPGPTGDQFLKFSNDDDFLKKFNAYKWASPIAGFAFIGYNETKPMFKDKETRRALTMLIDRKAIIHTILKDIGTEMVSSFSPLSPQHDPTVQALPYDPDGAKQLLAQAGWKPGADGILERNGVKFEFDLSMGAGNVNAERIANYVKEQFAHAGINMKITPWEFAVLMGRVDDRNFDAVTMGWSAIVEDDPFQVFDSKSIANKGSNAVGFNNKEADELIETARRTMDPDKRNEMWHKFERLMVEEQPYTFLYGPVERAFVAKRFENSEPYRLDLVPFDWYVPAGAQKYR